MLNTLEKSIYEESDRSKTFVITYVRTTGLKSVVVFFVTGTITDDLNHRGTDIYNELLNMAVNTGVSCQDER